MSKANKIYYGLIGVCDKLEYKGSSHHLAQRLTKAVLIELLPKKQRRVFDALDQSYQSAKELSDKTLISTKEISALISQIERNHGLVFVSKRENKFRYKSAINAIA